MTLNDIRIGIRFILPYLKNKYFITVIVLFTWMLFFDRYDLIYQYKLRRDLRKLQSEKSYYLEQIEEINKINDEVFTSDESLEKFAREKYLMKRDNEDIFLIIKE